MTYNVAVLHVPEDESQADRIGNRLEQEGFAVWRPGKDIVAGEHEYQEINRAIGDVWAIVLCLSKLAIGGSLAHRTIQFVGSDYKRLIPVILEQCSYDLIRELRGLKVADCQYPNFETGVNQVVQSLRSFFSETRRPGDHRQLLILEEVLKRYASRVEASLAVLEGSPNHQDRGYTVALKEIQAAHELTAEWLLHISRKLHGANYDADAILDQAFSRLGSALLGQLDAWKTTHHSLHSCFDRVLRTRMMVSSQVAAQLSQIQDSWEDCHSELKRACRLVGLDRPRLLRVDVLADFLEVDDLRRTASRLLHQSVDVLESSSKEQFLELLRSLQTKILYTMHVADEEILSLTDSVRSLWNIGGGKLHAA